MAELTSQTRVTISDLRRIRKIAYRERTTSAKVVSRALDALLQQLAERRANAPGPGDTHDRIPQPHDTTERN